MQLIGQFPSKIQLTLLNGCTVLKWSPEFCVCCLWSSRKQSKAVLTVEIQEQGAKTDEEKGK